MNCLFIDTSTNGFDVLSSSCNDNTIFIPYSSTTLRSDFISSFQTATQSLPLPVTRIAFAFHYSSTYLFLENEEIFTEANTQFLVDFIQTNSIERIDFLACNTLQDNNWALFYETLVNSTEVILGASNNDTGNIQYGGDWVMENTSEDIEAVYFTENIGYYTYLLGNPSGWSSAMFNNKIYYAGSKANGEPGDYSTTNAQAYLRQVYNTTGKLISGMNAQPLYSQYLMQDGTVYVVGLNNQGQLGQGDNVTRTSFTQVTFPEGGLATDFVRFRATSACCAKMTDGSYNVWGLNTSGQLGLDNSANQLSPVRLNPPAGKTIKQIVCGQAFIVILMTDNTIYTAGSNTQGYSGIGTVSATPTVGLTLIPSNLMPPGTVKELFSGYYAWFALMETSNDIYAVGWNSTFCQLGILDSSGSPVTTPISSLTKVPNNTTKTPSKIFNGDRHTMVLMTDGTLYGMGLNTSGQLGILDSSGAIISPVLSLTPVNTLPGGTTIEDVALGTNVSIIKMTNNTFYGAGSRGTVGMFGNYTFGGFQTSFTQILTTAPAGQTWTKVQIGENNSFILSSIGNAYACGNMDSNNGLGQPWNMWTLPRNLTGKTISSIATGANHQIALMTDNTIWGTGLNTSGQLGLGTISVPNTTSPVTVFTQMNNATSQTPSQIFCGNNHTIIRMANNSIYGTGLNTSGQLGNSSTTSVSYLVQMSIPGSRIPSQIACGGNHTIVLMTDNTIFGTGLNTSGQLGNSSTTSVSSLSLAQMTIPSGKTPSKIACGDNHTIVLMTDNTIYGTGLNTSGQLGNNSTSSVSSLSLAQMTIPVGKTPSQIFCGSNHTIVLMTDGTLYGTGLNTSGQLGINSTSSVDALTLIPNNSGTPSQVYCGTTNTKVVMTNNTVYGTGSNTNGELGTGDRNNRQTLTVCVLEDVKVKTNQIPFRLATGYMF